MARSNVISVSTAAYTVGLVAGLGVALLGCGSSSGNGGNGGSGGGSVSTGGATGSGGRTGSGGATRSGGATGSGGSIGTGGSAGSGTGGSGTGGSGTGGSGTAGSGTGGSGTGGRGTGGSGTGGTGPADAGTPTDAGANSLSFFVTSTGSGTAGGNLSGIPGADAKCQALAAAVNQGGKIWHAYLSTSAAPAVNARQRIGTGPWFNANGVMIASSVAQLHDEGGMNLLNATNSVDERGATIPTNQHDILTGSTTAGMALPATPDRTCADWTSNAAGTAQVGHENRAGGGDIPTSWNSAHATPTCSQASIMQVGGAGRLYCFATN